MTVASTPVVTALRAIPVAGRDSMLLNLSGAQKRNSGTWATTLTEADMATIGAFKTLETLDLAGLRVSNLGLAQLRSLTKLREIDLSKTQVTSDGLATLAAMPDLATVKLWMAAGVDDAAAAQLAGLRKLRLLDVTETALTQAGVERIHKALPACRILGR